MYHIIVQFAADKTLAPKASLLKQWAKKALVQKISSAELGIRIVGVEEMAELNKTYRFKDKPTNVLSFPFEMPPDVETEIPILGDIVICADIVNQEAAQQGKSSIAHWAHMVVHGVFHLLGYDHENDQDAKIMESLEIQTLKILGFDNPYEIGESNCHHE